MPAETFKAKLTRLSGAIDARLRSQRVEADIDNTDGKFIVGSVADVSTTLQSSPNSYVIPKSALVNSVEGFFVIQVADGKAQRVNGKKGLESNDEIEVIGELSEGDVLVKKASDEIKEGQELR